MPSSIQPTESSKPSSHDVALLCSVFVIAACGLLYELAAGTLASYILGDSVLQFSTIIGCYLFAMGIGSWFSQYIDKQLPSYFFRIELLIGLLGGCMAGILFLVNSYAPSTFRPLLYGWVFVIGTLVGLEIPLVMRILKRNVQLKQVVSQVLTFDYLGALLISVAFPLWFVPHMGIVRTGLFFGLMNTIVALWSLHVFKFSIPNLKAHWLAGLITCAILLAGFANAQHITSYVEDQFYHDPIILNTQTPYQKIVLTQGKAGLRLFLNGNLQFAQADEYRYHEALVHPVMAAHGAPKRVAILGGGDGMAVREVLKYPSVEHITLIELDPMMTQLFRDQAALTQLNQGSLHSTKLSIVNQDAFTYLEKDSQFYDIIIVDFPDPSHYAIGKLYTTSFYAMLEKRLAASGYAVIQSTSPLVARHSFWTVVTTLEAVGLDTTPYHALVPSFGEWGFIIASKRPYRMMDTATAHKQLPAHLQFLGPNNLASLFDFPKDMSRVPAQANRLHSQNLVTIFEQEWGKVLH